MAYVSERKLYKFEDFCVSSSYPDIAKRMPLTTHHKLNIALGESSILAPLHSDMRSKLHILSGYRNKELNRAVGGAEGSDHLEACAVDVVHGELSPFQLYTKILMMGLPFRQLIYYHKRKFVHISWNTPSKDYKHEAFMVED